MYDRDSGWDMIVIHTCVWKSQGDMCSLEDEYPLMRIVDVEMLVWHVSQKSIHLMSSRSQGEYCPADQMLIISCRL